MILEFYGLPGSGKTTLMEALIKEDGCIRKRINGKQIPGRCHLKNALTPEFFHFLRGCCSLALSCRKHGQPVWPHVASMMRIYLIYMWDREHAHGVYRCYDHGILQSLAALMWTDYSRKDQALKLAELFCKNMSSSLRLVFLRSEDYQEIYQRMLRRGERRRILERLSREQAVSLLETEAGFFREVAEIARKQGMGIELDAMGQVAVSAEAVREQLA